MKQIIVITLSLFTGLVLMALKGQALAEPDATAGQPLALRNIMQEMGKNEQSISAGILREDWAVIEKSAFLIAEHPAPPFLEKVRILSFVGTSMGKYKSYDGATHDAAVEINKAAKDKNGEGVILALQKLQLGCNNCHREFRKKFVEHFYGDGEIK